MTLGLQCQMLRNPVATNEFYHLHSPIAGSNLVAGTTIRYEIGTATDPTAPDTDGDGILDGYDPFPRDASSAYYGQCEEWVRANFTNAEEILDVGYANWVDAQVGCGLENGLYKLTVSVTDAPPSAVSVGVGELSVVATNVGDYVFLLEKGFDYSLSVSGCDVGVAWSAVDDITMPHPLSAGISGGGDWTVGGGDLRLMGASYGRIGSLRWNPVLKGSPGIQHLGPGDFSRTFTANISDYKYAQNAVYHWAGGNADIVIVSPNSQTTDVVVRELPSWRQVRISVTSDIFGETLESHLDLSYGENETPQVHLNLDVPEAVLLNDGTIPSDKLRPMSLSFSSDVPTNGEIRLLFSSNGGWVRCFKRNQNSYSTISISHEWSVSSFEGFNALIEGYITSRSCDDIAFTAIFTPEIGEPISVTRNLTVIKVGNVILPGEPDEGLVVLRGTSVAMEVECEPQGAGSMLSSLWSVRRFRCDGSLTDWEYAASSYHGGSVIYAPQNGGIYQARVFASLGYAGSGVEERHYLWSEDENEDIGLRRKGEEKAFGVVTKQWQIDVLNHSRMHLASTAYLTSSAVPSLYGYPAYPAGIGMYKCNLFVAHRAHEAGCLVPKIRGGVRLVRTCPPLANDWADANVTIRGWRTVSEQEFPEPGYVAATHDPDNGHVGFVDFDGMGISAGQFNVNRKFEACSSESHYRTYEETNE